VKLTKSNVRTLPPGFHWDDVLPGFGVRVLESGRRSFVVRYRTASGTDRLMTLGTAEELHPEAARELARQARAEVRHGHDPKVNRTKARTAPRLEDLKDRFMKEHASQKKPGTRANYEILWRRHILPIMGNPAVAEVTEADILRVKDKMAETPINANRAVEVLSKAFNLAERWRLRPLNSNPCHHVEAFAEAAVERILEPAEVAAIWHQLDADDILPSMRALIRLLAMTGCRSSEWRLALWSWVDLRNAVLRLPDSKTGAKTVPLSPDVVEILRSLPRSSIYVLPGLKGGPLGGHRRIWLRILARAGVTGRVRIHDLRHTVGSYAHRAGASQREVADLLGHKQMSTAARYIHGPESERHSNAARASGALLEMARKKN
jgi:integrase